MVLSQFFESETASYLITRLLAYCLCYEEGIEFSHGLSHAEEPAVWQSLEVSVRGTGDDHGSQGAIRGAWPGAPAQVAR